MGINLKLLIVNTPPGMTLFGSCSSAPPLLLLATTVLDLLLRADDLWERIRGLPSEVIPPNVCSYGARVPDGSMEDESCFGEVTTDSYGAPLRWVEARALTALSVAGHSHYFTAAWAYLRALPPSTVVILQWY